MTKRRQMLHRLPYAVKIVDPDVAHPWSRGSYVHKYQRHIAHLEVFEKEIFHSERHHRDPVHPPLDHAANRSLHAFRIINRGGQQDVVVMLNRNRLEYLDNLGKERIDDLGDDQAENPAAPGHQRSGLSVGIISQFIHYPPDTLGERWIDRWNPVNG